MLNFEIPRAATLALKTPSGSRGTYAEWRSNNKQSTEAIKMGIYVFSTRLDVNTKWNAIWYSTI